MRSEGGLNKEDVNLQLSTHINRMNRPNYDNHNHSYLIHSKAQKLIK